MPSVQDSDKKIDCIPDNIEELKSYKYLLGDFGISMLIAVERGARNNDAIMMLSGVPPACITGRMPVLLKLNLIQKNDQDEIILTDDGLNFLKVIDEI
jgi:hypothetical protein